MHPATAGKYAHMSTYTVTLRGKEVKVDSEKLEAFRGWFIGNAELSKRISELLLVDVYVLNTEFGVSPDSVLGAIHEVENGESPTGIKAASKFKNLPLKGLWHKHYFSAHFIAKNLQMGLGKKGLGKIIRETLDPAKSPVITREMIGELSRRVTREPLEERNQAKKLTGEWVIYLPHEGKNYYLCCTTHGTGDQLIHDRIVQHCPRDFPDLLNWWKARQ
jgi:hypothetical protein